MESPAAENFNWAGNYQFQASAVHRPSSVEELQDMVRQNDVLRAVGTRHSFNGIADTPQVQISTQSLNRVVALSAENQSVTVEGGITYGRLAEYLQANGFALPNLASLPHISVAGACVTATHGSGDLNGNLATSVVSMDLVVADGSVVQLSRQANPDVFDGAVVNLGSLGVVARLTLKVEPTYSVRQYVFERLPLLELESHFDDVTTAAYSVSLFYDWQTESINQVWLKFKGEAQAPPALFGAKPATVNRHPLEVNSAENCTEQLGVPGPWHQRLPHFRMDFTPSNGEELQTEFFVPRRFTVPAIQAIRSIRRQLEPLLYISEIRTVAADDLWLSPCYQEACVGIHFTWKQKWAEVSQLIPTIEHLLEPFEPRPHWGKIFVMDPTRVQARYPRLGDFRRLRSSLDPHGKFSNEFVRQYL